MHRTIPTTLGLLGLSIASTGCSDANKVASALQKVCDAQCTCPEAIEDWNDVKNCEKACEGYSQLLEAYIDDQAETEPCADLKTILKDIENCAENSCGESRYACLDTAYYDLGECWDFFGSVNNSYPYPSYPLVPEDDGGDGVPPISPGELVQQLMTPIPGAIDAEALHAATKG